MSTAKLHRKTYNLGWRGRCDGDTKEANEAAAVAAAGPAAGGAAAAEEKAEEKKKEEVEDVDMGGLFGGDDEY